MPKPLVIVESPAKARTIAGFLGADYLVESSVGHIRDLPRSSKEIPKAYKGEEWAQRTGGVDYTSDFKPIYIVPPEKKDQVNKLKSLLTNASEVFLATDEDREGESIAWHLLEVLSPGVPVRRMVFHEITDRAIHEAIENWRELDRRLVDAQEARRILDRLVGWEVSPILWRMVRRGLSAGRVQSVATRLIVDRERERMAFRSASYHDIAGTFEARDIPFPASLVEVDGRRVASGRDFDPATGQLKGQADAVLLGDDDARTLVRALDGAEFTVATVDAKDYTQSPVPPFITSTLQQEAARKLRFSAGRTMAVAQRLYERGYITYMRTDSTNLSEQAVAAARGEVRARYGNEYLPATPRTYQKKVKSAQEAHEAIRPAGESFRHPDEVARELDNDESRLYDLVWKRTVACQMADAKGKRLSLRLTADAATGDRVVFAASGKTIEFPGFLRAYVEGSDDPDADLEDQERRLPSVEVGEQVACQSLESAAHSTQPPARYTEASLVKELENRGIGRPSTYASVLDRIQSVGYVFKKGTALVPSWTGMAVTQLLERHFAEFVDYDFTARMEEDLDAMASGDIELAPWLHDFYFGNGQVGLRQMVDGRLDDVSPRDVCTIPIGRVPADGDEGNGDGDDSRDEVVVRVGRYGPYIQRGEIEDAKASIPDDLPPDELSVEDALVYIEQQRGGGRVLGVDPETDLEVTLRSGRFGPYFQLGELKDGAEKPKTASLFKGMDPDAVSLDEALRLLSLPRVVGMTEAGEEITAQTGRFGPYIRAGKETRSLDDEEQIFSLTEEDARRRLNEPKQGRRRGPAVLKELGEHPSNGESVRILDGRFGPYVTDGSVNASLPKGRTPEEVEMEEALHLLAERAARAPAKKKRPTARKKATKKKATAKKATAKKATSAGVKKAAATPVAKPADTKTPKRKPS
ncbi:MAG TPA: type I DNA topoisomerase [Acidimicrobiia bacterium]|nr:type I DNA topoisomerase [Acidimicrobiia bacterium]